MSKVPWVVVRRMALARAMAIRAAGQRGLNWWSLSQATRDNLVKQEENAINEWTRLDVVIQFQGDYREADDGGEPLVEWKDTKTVDSKTGR